MNVVRHNALGQSDCVLRRDVWPRRARQGDISTTMDVSAIMLRELENCSSPICSLSLSSLVLVLSWLGGGELRGN
jgi:hypothetical protein